MSYLVISYTDGEIGYEAFDNNSDVANHLEDLANSSYGNFEPMRDAMVIKLEEPYAILTIETRKEFKVSIGGC